MAITFRVPRPKATARTDHSLDDRSGSRDPRGRDIRMDDALADVTTIGSYESTSDLGWLARRGWTA